jgi:hypothetical protein
MMFQWEVPDGAAWSSNLEKSFSGLGCDVWVSRILTVSAEEYVTEWISDLSAPEQADAETLAEQARKYFQEKNIASTSTGTLTLHRASQRRNYLWFDEAPEDRLEPYGASVAALCEIRARVEEIGDSGLLQQKLQVSPHLTLLQTSKIQDHKWSPADSELSLTQGLKYSFGEVEVQLLELLPVFDGKLTVRQALRQMEIEYPTDNNIVAVYLPKIRELLWYGFLIPA